MCPFKRKSITVIPGSVYCVHGVHDEVNHIKVLAIDVEKSNIHYRSVFLANNNWQESGTVRIMSFKRFRNIVLFPREGAGGVEI